MINRCFKDQEVPAGVAELCEIYLDEYQQAKQHSKSDYSSDAKAKVKEILYAYYAQKYISTKKWERNLVRNKRTDDHTLEIVDAEYRAATKASKDGIEHFNFCIETGVYSDCSDHEINQRLRVEFDLYQEKEAAITSPSVSVVLRCFKTALTLQLVNAHQWIKRDAAARADCISDTLTQKTKSIKYQKNITYIDGYSHELICFTTS